MILLDTNALVALLIYPHRLGKRTQQIIEKSGEAHCSSISLAELHIKSLKRKFDVEPLMARLALEYFHSHKLMQSRSRPKQI
jgi:PIN domain nuclease of toxin-antitoxin system